MRAATHEREWSTIVHGPGTVGPLSLLISHGLLDLVAPQQTRLARSGRISLELAELGPGSLLAVQEGIAQN